MNKHIKFPSFNTGKPKENGYSRFKANAREDKRIDEAFNRNLEYSKLTLKQKLARAKKRGGKKEIAKIQAAIDADSKAAK